MLENVLMPREYGFKTNSYEVLDDDIIDALPKAQQDKYIEKKIAPQIEEEIKDIEFENEADKLKVYTQAVSNKTAKEWGTRHANNLKPFDSGPTLVQAYFPDAQIEQKLLAADE